MTTYTQKLRASIAYNTDNYSLDCNVPGVPALELCGPSKKPVKVEAIVLDTPEPWCFTWSPTTGSSRRARRNAAPPSTG